MNGSSMFTPEELQARKQIWWACIRADKYVEFELVYIPNPVSSGRKVYRNIHGPAANHFGVAF